jgi:hypothetical protein
MDADTKDKKSSTSHLCGGAEGGGHRGSLGVVNLDVMNYLVRLFVFKKHIFFY